MIVWITASDPRGNAKRRPVVIVTADHQIAVGRQIVGVAVTTTFPDPPPADHVPLPWDPTRRSVTRLRRRSAAVCTWLVPFEPDAVDEIGGHVPAGTLLQI